MHCCAVKRQLHIVARGEGVSHIGGVFFQRGDFAAYIGYGKRPFRQCSVATVQAVKYEIARA